jgi:hypothetical protein
MDDIDHDKLDAALERLEAERERRLAERIEAGEILSVPLVIVAGTEPEALARVEGAKAGKLAELRAAGDLREVKFTVELIVTGVCKHGEATVSEPWKPMSPPFLPRSARRDEVVEEEAVREEPQPPIIETYVQVQIRQCQDDDDPGEIAEGWFSVNNGVVTVTDVQGREIGGRAMLSGEDARVVAKQLLREKKVPESENFNRPLSYPNAGLA